MQRSQSFLTVQTEEILQRRVLFCCNSTTWNHGFRNETLAFWPETSLTSRRRCSFAVRSDRELPELRHSLALCHTQKERTMISVSLDFCFCISWSLQLMPPRYCGCCYRLIRVETELQDRLCRFFQCDVWSELTVVVGTALWRIDVPTDSQCLDDTQKSCYPRK